MRRKETLFAKQTGACASDRSGTLMVVGAGFEDVERITGNNQNRKMRREAAMRKKAEEKKNGMAALAGVICCLITAAACMVAAPWWTAVSPIVLMVGVMRKAGWV